MRLSSNISSISMLRFGTLLKYSVSLIKLSILSWILSEEKSNLEISKINSFKSSNSFTTFSWIGNFSSFFDKTFWITSLSKTPLK